VQTWYQFFGQERVVDGDANQDRMLGAILGLAIGDAFGMPVAGLSPATIVDFYGSVDEYLPRKFPDGAEVSPGEITDDTEIALCVIESVTAAQGEIDVENIGIRMQYLARSASRRWLSPEIADALDGRSEEYEFQLPLVDNEPVGADVLARGVPIGLMHSMGRLDADRLRADVAQVTRITHGSPLALSAVEAVALSVALSARNRTPLPAIARQVAAALPPGELQEALAGGSTVRVGPAASTLRESLAIAAESESFDVVLTRAVASGGPADTRAALAAAIYAAHLGSSVIPQGLIDGLESRIYLSLAVPWFYRTVARMRGRAIDLRPGLG
jgi:ADP-ribosylglycohydrolase